MAAARAEIGGAPPSLQEVMRTPGAAAAQGGVTRGCVRGPIPPLYHPPASRPVLTTCSFLTESSRYGFIATPSPAPGVDESPFITWGRMDATPLRLDPTETPMDIGGGGAGGFSMKPERARGAPSFSPRFQIPHKAQRARASAHRLGGRLSVCCLRAAA